MLNLDTVKRASVNQERTMDVPLLGDTVRIKMFRKGDIDAMRAESLVAGELNNAKFERLLVMRGLIEPAFDDAGYDDLARGNAAVYYSLLNAVMEGNGLTELAKSGARRTFPA